MTMTDLSPRSGAPSLIPEPMVLEARYANLWQEARELEAGQGGGVAPGVGRWIAAVLTLKLSFLPIPRPRNGNTHRTLPAGECIPRMGLLKPSLCAPCVERQVPTPKPPGPGTRQANLQATCDQLELELAAREELYDMRLQEMEVCVETLVSAARHPACPSLVPPLVIGLPTRRYAPA